MLRRRPVTLLAVALLALALDFRVVHIDLLPDAVGWLLVAAAAVILSQRLAAGLALAAALATAPDVALAHHYDPINPLTGEVVQNAAPGTAYPEWLAFDRLSDARSAAAVLGLVLGAAALVALLRVLRQRAAGSDDEQAERLLGVAQWLVPAGWAIPTLVVWIVQWAADEGIDPVWNGALELEAVVGMAVLSGTALSLFIRRNRGWAAVGEGELAPWASLVVE